MGWLCLSVPGHDDGVAVSVRTGHHGEVALSIS